MSQAAYRRLAQRLDTIPNGFAPAPSGVELRLLAKLFTPEEAELACTMRLTRRTAAELAAAAGIEPAAARRLLKSMVGKGLIGVSRGEHELVYGLLPFAVGFYENQLPTIDAELALLVEQYFQETQGASITRDGPALHRVIPVEEAIPFSLEVFPYERASELLEGAKSWAVRDCICRAQRRLIGQGCDYPLETCLTFAPVEGAFDHDPAGRPISKEEALRLLREAEEAGLVHTTGNYRDGHSYICNCCTCCCGVLRGVAEFSIPGAIAHSDFYARVESEACIGCGACVERCPFKALSVPDGLCVVDPLRCVGCGLCAAACPSGALCLERRPAGETPTTPANLISWMLERAQQRGINLNEIV